MNSRNYLGSALTLLLFVISCTPLRCNSTTPVAPQLVPAQDVLTQHGGKVIVLGDKIKIVLPTALLFNNMTTHLHNGAYKILDAVITYLNNFTIATVKVAAYTNNTRDAKLNKILSTMQAEQIARYLQAHHLQTRFLVALGYGGTNLMSVTSYSPNAQVNYRIEITTND